jgi:hypothetical protein
MGVNVVKNISTTESADIIPHIAVFFAFFISLTLSLSEIILPLYDIFATKIIDYLKN